MEPSHRALSFKSRGVSLRAILHPNKTSTTPSTNTSKEPSLSQNTSKYFSPERLKSPTRYTDDTLKRKDISNDLNQNEPKTRNLRRFSSEDFFQEKSPIEQTFPNKEAEGRVDVRNQEELENLENVKEPKLNLANKKPSRDKPNNLGGEKLVEQNTFSRKKPIQLSPEQKRTLTLALEEKCNIFFTGSAGTGKSLLLQELIKRMRGKYRREEVAVTASTGIAACNIGGTTLHSFAGVGLGSDGVDQLLKMVLKQKRTKKRWIAVKVLIIDEISMLDGAFFDKLEFIARRVRACNKPFGGIQLVTTGDFFQLPPVSKDSLFCFEAASWKSCIQNTIHLTQVFRQREQSFVDILNSLRIGILPPESELVFLSLSRVPQFPNDGIEPTRLYALRGEVDAANARKLDSLSGVTHRYIANDLGQSPFVEKLSTNCLAPNVLELKLHAQVLLIRNLDNHLVNGSLGVVVGFEEEGGMPIVRFTNCTITVTPETWKIEVPGLGEVASRTQVPLILSWAMSIHKAQGQTLDRVVVDLSRVFEKGQAYVALSRATTLEGLQVLNFDRRKVMAHPKVVQFYRSLLEDELSSSDLKQ